LVFCRKKTFNRMRSFFSPHTQLLIISQLAIHEVHKKGYYQGVTKLLEDKFSHMLLKERAYLFSLKIINTIQIEEGKVLGNEHVPGSSEVLEPIVWKIQAIRERTFFRWSDIIDPELTFNGGKYKHRSCSDSLRSDLSKQCNRMGQK